MNHCFKVFGVDSAFLDTYKIKYRETEEISSFIKDLESKFSYIIQKCFLTGLSGRTLNNEMILFAFCISDAENSVNYDFFFKFLTANQVSI